MAHLGADIAAVVDEQMDPARLDVALEHLHHCEACRAAVRAQRLAKAQVTTLRPVEPPVALVESLCAIRSSTPNVTAPRHSLSSARVLVAGGLSLAVVSGASMVMSPEPRPMRPMQWLPQISRVSQVSPASGVPAVPAVYTREAATRRGHDPAADPGAAFVR